MTRPPAFHIWKFLMKNMTSPNSGLNVIVHVIKLVASTAMLLVNINSSRGNMEKSVPSFPYPVPTSVMYEVSLEKT